MPVYPSPRALFPTTFDDTLGALLVGGLVATALWGVACVQTYNYYVAIKNKDRLLFRLMVGFLWTLDTFDAMLNGHSLYFYLVTHFANPFNILQPTWSVLIRVATTSTSNLIIRILFAHRVYRLSKGNLLLTSWILAISLCSFIVGIILTVKAFTITIYPELAKFSSLLYLMFSVGTTSDLSITLVLSYLLRKSRTGYSQTDSVIKVLMLYTVNTGLVFAIDATAAMVTYIAMPNNFIFISIYLLLGKLYFNAYLATLNAREFLRTKAESSIQLSHLSQSRRAEADGWTTGETVQGLSRDKSTSKPQPHMAISIHTLVDQKIDEVASYPSRNSFDYSARAV